MLAHFTRYPVVDIFENQRAPKRLVTPFDRFRGWQRSNLVSPKRSSSWKLNIFNFLCALDIPPCWQSTVGLFP